MVYGQIFLYFVLENVEKRYLKTKKPINSLASGKYLDAKDKFIKFLGDGNFYNYKSNTFDHHLIGPVIFQNQSSNKYWYVLKNSKHVKLNKKWQSIIPTHIDLVTPVYKQLHKLRSSYLQNLNKFKTTWKKPKQISKNVQNELKVIIGDLISDWRQVKDKKAQLWSLMFIVENKLDDDVIDNNN